MSEMVERLAICLRNNFSQATPKGAEMVARLLIEVMREPTETMVKAEGVYENCYMCGGAGEAWRLMIDEALK